MKRPFRFGVANSDHQVEAYNGHDDNWDVWERNRNLTARGRAADFWNRYREDIDLAKELGCTVFRISISWARLETAPGVWDEAAFEHYREVLQYMRDAGMETCVTLHHNVWPLHIQAAGNGAGMTDPKFPQRFEQYATQAAKRLGDLIDFWITINEPNQLVFGYYKTFWMSGFSMPPGLDPYSTPAQQMTAVLALIPSLFRSHTLARAAIHRERPGASVGANPNVFGLPRWLRRIVDGSATTLRSPADAIKQTALLTKPAILNGGKVDISIAQVALTQDRMTDVLYSAPYLDVHPAALHAEGVTPPTTFKGWTGKVGVISGSVTSARAKSIFVSADIFYYRHVADACAALRAGNIELIVDDDAILQQRAVDGLALSRLHGSVRHYAVATALGNHTLLDAVDEAIGAYRHAAPHPQAIAPSSTDTSLATVRKHRRIRIGIHPDVVGLCESDGNGGYRGKEIDLARKIAAHVLQTPNPKIIFVPLHGHRRLSAARSWLSRLDGLRTMLGLLGTLFGTNWWNLGLGGKLPTFLCPAECVGQLDFVGIDYYWGVPSIWPQELRRLAAASEFRYSSAPVWPGGLKNALDETLELFPGKPIVVVENGSVANADGFSRADYLDAHIKEVTDAADQGAPIVAYLCWSITTNREWGLPLDENSDFGLYHIDLDNDPDLKRQVTPSAERYRQIIARHAVPPEATETV